MRYDAKDLEGLSMGLKAITKQTEQLATVVRKLEKAQAVEKRKARAETKTRKKAALKRKAAAKKAAERVLKIVKKSQKGVGVSALVKKTGLSEKGVRTIISKGIEHGKIMRIGWGVYAST